LNNLIEWEGAKEQIKNALQSWSPHFELLRSEDTADEQILMLFILSDTTKEWKLYNDAPEEVAEDFADYTADAKDELLERIGFDLSKYEHRMLTDRLADEMSVELKQLMERYEKETNKDIKELYYNTLMYCEWVILPEEELEERYEQEL
jgi:hypothetical protein